MAPQPKIGQQRYDENTDKVISEIKKKIRPETVPGNTVSRGADRTEESGKPEIIMKAVVLEIRDGEAAVLREDGVVVRVRQACEVGDTIEVAEEKERHLFSVRSVRCLAAAACLALVLTGTGVHGYNTALACTYVSVDAEIGTQEDKSAETVGSVEYVLNRKNRIIRAEGRDEAGKAMAEELMRRGVKGMELAEALTAAEEVMKEKVPEDRGDITRMLVNVSADSSDRRDMLVREAARSFEAKDPDMQVDVTENTLADRKKAEELGISAGRYEERRQQENRPEISGHDEENVPDTLSETEDGKGRPDTSVNTGKPVQKTEESVSGQGEGSDRESELRPDESPEQKSEERPEQKPEQSPQQGMEASPEAGKSFTDGSMEGKNEPAGHDGTVTDGGAEGSMPEQDIFRESGVGPAGDAEPAPEEPAASDRASEDPGTSYRAPEGRDGSGGDGGPDRGHEGGRGPM